MKKRANLCAADLQKELVEKYPDWEGEIVIVEIQKGQKYGKGAPYAIVKTNFAYHKVSVGNLRKGNFPTDKTAIDPEEYKRNYNAYMIGGLRKEIFTSHPSLRDQVEFMEYLQGKDYEEGGKKFQGGPHLRVKSKLGIHIVSVRNLRLGYSPSIESLVEPSETVNRLPEYSSPKLADAYEVKKKINNLSDLDEFCDTSALSEEKIEFINNNIPLYLVEQESISEYFLVRKQSIVENSKPSVKSALNEISLLNKLTPNDRRKHPIKVIRRLGKIREELSYEIEWCGCRFEKEQSWILNSSGSEPDKLRNSLSPLNETANGIFQYRNPELANELVIIQYIPGKKHPRVIIKDSSDKKYNCRWSDILEGKLPSQRSATDISNHLEIEMKQQKAPLLSQVKVLGYGSKAPNSNTYLIRVRYIRYDTLHEVYKSALLKAEALTAESAIDPLNFIRQKTLVDHPELYEKIEILGIEFTEKQTKRDPLVRELIAEVRVKSNGEIFKVPASYITKNKYLSGILNDWTQLPIDSIVRTEPDKLFNFYFMQIAHPEGYKSFKIGYTSYDTPDERVKTLHSNWYLIHCICFCKIPAREIYNYEKEFKKLPSPRIPKLYKPKNGFTEFIWTIFLAEKWDKLQSANLTIDETIDLLKEARCKL